MRHAMTRIVTTNYRYKRPPRKRKPHPAAVPAIVTNAMPARRNGCAPSGWPSEGGQRAGEGGQVNVPDLVVNYLVNGRIRCFWADWRPRPSPEFRTKVWCLDQLRLRRISPRPTNPLPSNDKEAGAGMALTGSMIV